MDNYTILEEIGSGSSGTIFKVQNKSSNEILAMKRIESYANIDNFISEISIMKSINHANIVRIIDVFFDEHYGYYIMPFYDKSLHDYIVEVGGLEDEEVLKYTLQLLSAVKYLHDNGILHRDIKPHNILIKDGNVHIADFGSAIVFVDNQRLSPCIQTQNYKAPEVLLESEKYDGKVDVWSIGCTIAEMVNGKGLFNEEDDMNLLIKIVSILGSRSKIIHKTFTRKVQIQAKKGLNTKEFIFTSNRKLLLLCRGMLQVNPDHRFSIDDSLLTIIGYYNYKKLPKYSINGKNGNYKILNNSPITIEIRESILDWVIRISVHFKYSDSTWINAISIIDKYTSIECIEKDEYQLMAICALYISSCLHNEFGLEESECIMLVKGKYQYEDIRKMIYNIFKVLGDNMNLTTSRSIKVPKNKIQNVMPIIKRILISFNMDWKNLNVMFLKLSDIYNIPLEEINIILLNKIYGKQQEIFKDVIGKIDELGYEYGTKEVVNRWNSILSHIKRLHNI